MLDTSYLKEYKSAQQLEDWHHNERRNAFKALQYIFQDVPEEVQGSMESFTFPELLWLWDEQSQRDITSVLHRQFNTLWSLTNNNKKNTVFINTYQHTQLLASQLTGVDIEESLLGKPLVHTNATMDHQWHLAISQGLLAEQRCFEIRENLNFVLEDEVTTVGDSNFPREHLELDRINHIFRLQGLDGKIYPLEYSYVPSCLPGNIHLALYKPIEEGISPYMDERQDLTSVQFSRGSADSKPIWIVNETNKDSRGNKVIDTKYFTSDESSGWRFEVRIIQSKGNDVETEYERLDDIERFNMQNTNTIRYQELVAEYRKKLQREIEECTWLLYPDGTSFCNRSGRNHSKFDDKNRPEYTYFDEIVMMKDIDADTDIFTLESLQRDFQRLALKEDNRIVLYIDKDFDTDREHPYIIYKGKTVRGRFIDSGGSFTTMNAATSDGLLRITLRDNANIHGIAFNSLVTDIRIV